MKQSYNILDFETTGFSADYDRVIEVGIVKVKDNKIVDQFESLVNPGIRVSSTITNLTGITNDMVKSAKSSAIIMPRLKKFVGNELIVAHNASFDARFYQAEMRRFGLNSSNDFLCSLLLARRMYQDLNSHKLGHLCHHLGFINKASHRALGDARVTFKVFHQICEKVKQRSGMEEIDLQYLAALSKVPKKKVPDWLQRPH